MMRDVMQNAGLETFAELGILIFFVTFILVAMRTLLTRNASYGELANLPMDEGTEVQR